MFSCKFAVYFQTTFSQEHLSGGLLPVNVCLEENKSRAVSQRYYVKEDVFKNFAKFTGKHRCPGLFLNKVAGLLLLRELVLYLGS